MIITIDGPSGTGKTTVARLVAQKIGYSYFDTGAMYRTFTYLMMQHQADLTNKTELKTILNVFRFEIRENNGNKQYLLDGADVTEIIRTPEISRKVSEVSALPEVRQALIARQREFGKGKNTVFEGRDMGTVVFPEAETKIFLDASLEVRALRRYKELKEKNVTTTEAEVKEEILKRDHYDSTRELSPLKPAKDAHLIDTSDLTIEQVIDRVLECIPKSL